MTEASPGATLPLLRLAISGTDTGIGKTVVATALTARAVQLGQRVAAMKPIESGIDERVDVAGARRSDAERLQEAAGGADDLSIVRPYALREPLAPMVAAHRAGVTVSLDVLDAAFNTLCTAREVIVVEGAGGLLVPITRTMSFLDLFSRWRCELIIVAVDRLGVLNHVLLTVRAAESGGLPVRAIILTSHTEKEATICEATNYDALCALLPHHTIIRFPWVDRTDSLGALAAAAERSGLDALLLRETPVPTAPGTLFFD